MGNNAKIFAEIGAGSSNEIQLVAASARINDLEEQNAALAAQVEALKDWRRLALQFDGHRMQAMSTLKMVATGNFDMEEVRRFIAAAPVSGDKHLAEIRAQAGELGYYNGFKDALVIEPPLPPATGTYATIDIFAYRVEQAARYAANQYADSIRQESEK